MLEEKMMAASDAMEYEQAIEYRELLNSVKQVAQKQKITSQSMERPGCDRHGEGRGGCGGAGILCPGWKDDRTGTFPCLRVYGRTTITRSSEAFVNSSTRELRLSRERSWVQENFRRWSYRDWLTKRRGQAVKFLVPKKGQKERLVELAEKNAKLVLTRIRIRSKEKNSGPSAP